MTHIRLPNITGKTEAQQLEQIKAISSMDELSAVTAKMHIETSSPFFGFYIGAD